MGYLTCAYKKESINLLKKIVEKAEELQIGLIPSFFWNVRFIPEHLNEPLTAWGDKNSKTRNYMREYTKEVVELLKDSKAIFGWEFGNEVNNICDLWPEYRIEVEGMTKEQAEGMMLKSAHVIAIRFRLFYLHLLSNLLFF